MKVFIAVDMEGISGIVHSSQASPGSRDYEWARRMMVGDANAAVQGALDGGATEIVVADAHDGMRNIRLDELHPAASLVSGGGRPLSMVQGIDDSFDAVFFVGFHTMCGVPDGILAHTYISRALQNAYLNDRPVGEIGLFAAVAGVFGVPVVLTTGDMATCAEAETFIEGITTVAVKKGINRFAAECLPQREAHRRIHDGAVRALQNIQRVRPFVPERPTTVAVELTGSQCADNAARVPGTVRTGDRKVTFTSENYLECFQAIRLMFDLAASAVDTDY